MKRFIPHIKFHPLLIKTQAGNTFLPILTMGGGEGVFMIMIPCITITFSW